MDVVRISVIEENLTKKQQTVNRIIALLNILIGILLIVMVFYIGYVIGFDECYNMAIPVIEECSSQLNDCANTLGECASYLDYCVNGGM